jgi:hypothetical protein
VILLYTLMLFCESFQPWVNVDEFLRIHKPSARALAKAKAEGLDLTTLKETNPTEYKMRTAQEVLLTSTDFVEMASSVFFAAFPHHDLFRLEHYQVTLLSFPELSSKDLKRWDDALGRLVLHAKYAQEYAYYRVINDKNGEVRHLGLPIDPLAYQGQINVLIGPFETQQAALHWGEAQVTQQQHIVDTVSYLEAWFCDVFSAEA